MPAAATRSSNAALRLFLDRLLRRSVLSAEEQEAILTLPTEPASFRPNQDFVTQGQRTVAACLVAEGLVGRFAQTSSGDRQIIEFHIPGDMADLHSVVAPMAPSALQALTSVSILRIPHEALRRIASGRPAIAHAFWRDGIVDASLIGQALVNLGLRDAAGRMAHLFCEMGLRYEQIGQGDRTHFRFPATQGHLGDALGLTPIHINRTLRVLREDGLVTAASREVTIHDWDRLVQRAEFDSTYLQLSRVDFHEKPAPPASTGH